MLVMWVWWLATIWVAAKPDELCDLCGQIAELWDDQVWISLTMALPPNCDAMSHPWVQWLATIWVWKNLMNFVIYVDRLLSCCMIFSNYGFIPQSLCYESSLNPMTFWVCENIMNLVIYLGWLLSYGMMFINYGFAPNHQRFEPSLSPMTSNFFSLQKLMNCVIYTQ